MMKSSTSNLSTSCPAVHSHDYTSGWHRVSLLLSMQDLTQELITVPVLPCMLQRGALHQAHNAPVAGHQGKGRTFTLMRIYGQ